MSFYARLRSNVALALGDWAHCIEFGNMKVMTVCYIFLLRICGIVRGSVVFAYPHFQHFQYFLFLIVYFFCFTAAASRDKRNHLNLCVGIRACSWVFTRLIPLVVVPEQLYMGGRVFRKKMGES